LYDKNLVKKSHIEINSAEIIKYKFNPFLTESNNKKLLFIEQNGENSTEFKDYKKDLKLILNSLLQRYDVYIKPHPRLGYSSVLDSCNVTILDAYYPMELMNLTDFDVVVTVFSSSIASINFASKFCLIDLFEYTIDIEKIKYLKKSLESRAEIEFHYIANIEELC
jgi:hypothetical protein